MNNRFKWDKTYLYWGVTAFCVITAGVLFYIGLVNWKSLFGFVNMILRTLSPVIYGLAVAYILSTPADFFERKVFSRFKKRGERFRRIAGTVTVMLITVAALAGALWMLIPRMYFSLEKLTGSLTRYLNIAVNWTQSVLDDNSELGQAVVSSVGSLTEYVNNFIESKILAQMDTIVVAVTSGVIDVIREIVNIVLGFAAAVYVLYSRDKVKSNAKKGLYAALKQRTAENILRSVSFVDKTCGSFIKSRLLDALVVGVTCYFGLVIFKIPYALLIAALIGITNVIPYFGPFLGGIPAALLVLLEQPSKCLIFVIFIVVLQQVDGNIIYPRIQGGSSGLSGFWILFAILLFGGLFGFAGMVLGVPVFTVIYYAAASAVKTRLHKRGLPLNDELYAAPGKITVHTTQSEPDNDAEQEESIDV